MLAGDLPPICFRVVSWVPQNGFIGRRLAACRTGCRVRDPAGRGIATSSGSRPLGLVLRSRAGGVFGGEAVDTGRHAVSGRAGSVVASVSGRPGLSRVFPPRRGGRNRQNSLSCAPCCTALSLSEQFQLTNLRMRDAAGKGTADERHPAELSSTCGVCRSSQRDRFGALDRSVPRRLSAARSGKALCV